MTPTPPPGTERPSTLKGPGWTHRDATHAQDVAAGLLWSRYGVASEVAPLRAVLLTWPGDNLAFTGEPRDWLMARRPDLERMREQAQGLAELYGSLGVEVRWIRPPHAAPPNLIFARDLFFMTPEGAILGRMAARQRAGEERHAQIALAAAGVPILACPTGHATFEGADALWVRPDRVLVGIGNRTNHAGFEVVARVLADQGVVATAVYLPDTVQHLLGAMNLYDEDHAVTLDATPSLRGALADLGIREVDFEPDDEIRVGRALNFVTIGPREVLMPAGAPRTRARLEVLGIRVHERPVGEYLRAEGGPGCLTGILARG